MEKVEIELYYRAESQVTYGDETFTDDCCAQFHDEIKVDPEGYDPLFSEYELMYTSTLEHLNCMAEKTWEKYDPPTSISIKITQMTKEEFMKGMN